MKTFLKAHTFKFSKNVFSSFNKFSFSTKNAAILLSGSGVYDGTEITEAVSMLITLSKKEIKYNCFSVNKDQMHVIDHTKGEEMKEPRNCLKESARISRGEVSDITTINPDDFDFLLIPGGFGAAKNFSCFVCY